MQLLIYYPYQERLRDRPCEVRQPVYRERICLVLIPADPGSGCIERRFFIDLEDEVRLYHFLEATSSVHEEVLLLYLIIQNLRNLRISRSITK